MSPLKKPTPRAKKPKVPQLHVDEVVVNGVHEKPLPQASSDSFHLLEELRRELEKGNQLNELRSTITRLENDKHNLEQQVKLLESRLQAQHGQITATVEALKNTVRGQVQNLDQQLQVFSLDTSHTIEGLLAVLHAASIPTPDVLQHQPSQPVQHMSIATHPVERPLQQQPTYHHISPATEEVVEPLIPEPSHQQGGRKKIRRLIMRSFYALLFAGIIGGGYLFLRPTTKIYQDGEVAGASTSPTPAPEENSSPDPYAASFAEVPFEKTEWELVSDADFGIAVQFPTNASTKVKVIGGNNLWFVRKSTYLMRFSRITTEETLDQWWAANSQTYTEQAKATKITYKGKPAYYLESNERTPTSGSSYIVKHAGNILVIWVKDEPTTTDDGKRITKMTESLTFTN
jgi:hypothetical protein